MSARLRSIVTTTLAVGSAVRLQGARVMSAPRGPRASAARGGHARVLRAASSPPAPPLARVLPVSLFSGVVSREWSRGARSGLPGTLVVIEAPASAGVPSPPSFQRATECWSAVAQAARAAFGEEALLGWLASGAVMGIVTPEPPAGLEVRFQAQLPGGLEIDGRPFRLGVRQCAAGAVATGAAMETASAWVELLRPGRSTRATHRLKRPIDLAGSVAGLLLCLPLMALVALAVKVSSPGPVLFRQRRVGRDGEPFTMLKFRTMRVNGDASRHQEFVSGFITAGSRQPADERPALYKLAADPRITRLGHLLRTSSVDELPQLWNVLRGEMSLVGPRPAIDYEVRQYQSWHLRRIAEALPGMTGLWQVTGRSRTTFDEMVRLDLRYVRTCSLVTDMRILLSTPWAVLSGKGAA